MAILFWLQGSPFPESFEDPNTFLLSLLPQVMAGSSRSSPQSPPLKRVREEAEPGSVTYEEMSEYISRWTSILDEDLEAKPRESEDSLSSALVEEEKKLSELEAELDNLPGRIQDVRTYQLACDYYRGFLPEAPAFNTAELDQEHSNILLGLQEATDRWVSETLDPLRQNGEDVADLDALEAQLEALPGLVDEAREDVSQAREKLVREQKLVALRERLMGMVHVLDRER